MFSLQHKRILQLNAEDIFLISTTSPLRGIEGSQIFVRLDFNPISTGGEGGTVGPTYGKSEAIYLWTRIFFLMLMSFEVENFKNYQ